MKKWVRRIWHRAKRLFLSIEFHTFGYAFFMMLGLNAELTAESDALYGAPFDLTGLSLEELVNIKVTSVSRKAQKLSRAPVAIFVITQKDIKRTGVTSIPEALRISPGLNVARVNKSIWSISARGFNSQFANKLLVMVDGRSVYTPLFSGVYWDVQDTLLEDIDRIEIIRGPGATLWGANAVNGVINIMTKRAEDTQGLLLSAGRGGEEGVFAGFRYGDKVGSKLHYRVYGKYFSRDESVQTDGSAAHDAREMEQVGFLLDWKPTDTDFVTFQGDFYTGYGKQVAPSFTLVPPYLQEIPETVDVSGGNALVRWTHKFSPGSDSVLQLYFDRASREMILIGEVRNTFDVDFQHRFRAGRRHEIVWGGGYRFSEDQLKESYEVRSIRDEGRGVDLFSAFVQDEIELLAERLAVTVGTKLEYNDFTGFEFQPSARILWTPTDGHTLWASVSRAVRTPSRAEHDIRLVPEVLAPTPISSLPLKLEISGNPDFGSEKLTAYEIGYRIKPSIRMTLDFAGYFKKYAGLRGTTTSSIFLSPLPVPHLVLPMTFSNSLSGCTYGAEVSAAWQATDRWRLQLSYSYLEMELRSTEGESTLLATMTENESPENQFSLRSSLDLPKQLYLDSTLRYVDYLPGVDIDSYLELDLRLGWRPRRNFELSIVGQNLLQQSHTEFPVQLLTVQSTGVERSIHGKVTLRF